MYIDKEEYKSLVNYVKNDLIDKNWERIIISVDFHNSGGYGDSVKYFIDDQEFEHITDIFETGPLLSSLFDDFVMGNKEREFNKVLIEVDKDNYSVLYQTNQEKIIAEKQNGALLFPYYLYEKMRTQIYDYEVANNLRIPIYDEEGLVYDYEESWDGGLFIFVVDIKTKTIDHKIELSLNGKKRIVPLELQEFYKEAIFTHYENTHGELKELWKPWNKIVVIAPENIIPVGKEQDYIEYYLEEKNQL